MLIGLSGKKHVGKDTCGHYLEVRYGFQRIAFADFLKAIARQLGWDGRKDEPGRRFLQELGEVVRRYNERFWIDGAFRCIRQLQEQGYRDFVITDMRYRNEVIELKALGGIAVRIWSAEEMTDDRHPSETELDGFLLWDYRLESIPGDFTGFYRQVDALIATERDQAVNAPPAVLPSPEHVG